MCSPNPEPPDFISLGNIGLGKTLKHLVLKFLRNAGAIIAD